MWFAMDSGQAPPTPARRAAPPRLNGSWPEVLRRRAWLTRTIGRWLPDRRWFAGKDAIVRDVTIDDIVELSDDVALLVVRTSFTEGDDQQYAVPLLHASRGAGASRSTSGRPARCSALTDDGAIVDAMAVPEGAGVVAAAALRRRTRRGRSAVATGHPRRPGLTKLADRPPRRPRARRRAVELVGDPRRPGHRQADPPALAGREPRRHAAAAPAGGGLRARARRRRHARRLASTAGRRATSSSSTTSSATRPTCGSGARTCSTRDVERLVTEPESHRRRGRAGGGHRARSASARPRCTSPCRAARRRSSRSGSRCCGSARSCRACGRRCARRSGPCAATGRRSRATREPLADVLLEHGDRLLDAFDVLRTRKLDAARIRVHGDLHLGQALWTGRDVVFIDFEGEPGRSIGERSIKRSPLADVAGMVRSFDYAGRVALATSAERGRTGVADAEHLERWRRSHDDADAGAVLVDVPRDAARRHDRPPAGRPADPARRRRRPPAARRPRRAQGAVRGALRAGQPPGVGRLATRRRSPSCSTPADDHPSVCVHPSAGVPDFRRSALR